MAILTFALTKSLPPDSLWQWIASVLGAGGASLFFILGRKLSDGRYAGPEERLFAQPLLFGMSGLFASAGAPALLQAILPMLDTPAWDAWDLPTLFALSALVSLSLLCRARYQQEASILCPLVFVQLLVAAIAASVNTLHSLHPVMTAAPLTVFLAAYGLVSCILYYPVLFLHARLTRALRLPPPTGQRPWKWAVMAGAAIEVLLLASLAVSKRISALPSTLPLAAGAFAELLGLATAVLVLSAFYHSKPPYPLDRLDTHAAEEEA
jgi:hypothetical protein